MSRSRRWRSSLVAIAVVVLVAAGTAAVPALAGAGGSHASSGLPPRVRPLAPGAPGAPAFHLPSGTPTTTVGKATRLGFCGGDDWEPEIASDAVHHVYVVWSHYPGDVACDPASGNANRVYIQVSKDDGRTFGRPHVVSDQPGGLDYPRQVDNVVASRRAA